MAQDIAGELTAIHIMPPVRIPVGSGTATYAGVDIRDFVGVIKVIVNHKCDHELSTNSVVYQIYDSADNSTFAVNTFATPVTTTASAYIGNIAVDTRETARYIQARHVLTGTTQTAVMSMVGVGLKNIV